jgi:hyperosmotically inducible periplasmic protein
MKRWTLVIAGSLVGWTITTGPWIATAAESGSATQERSGYDADNTGRNVRDRGDRPTAGTQSNDQDDVALTRQVRRAIVDDGSLSTNAHNVKIITSDGVVTLRGPVDSAQEKASVVAKAEHVPGVRHVDNQLEVTRR